MSPIGVGVILSLILTVQGGTPPSGGTLPSAGTMISAGVRPLQDITKDVQKIEEDEGLFDKYYQCLVDVGPCTQETKKLKDVIQEALERNCARCSAAQRRAAISLLKLAMECRPAQFRELEKRFDPRGTFMRKYKRQRGHVPDWRTLVPPQ